MRDLLQWRIRLPHRLDAHLTQVHRSQRAHVRVRTHYVHARRQQSNDLSEDDGLVGREIGGEDHPREVRLEQDERLEVRGLVVLGVELDGRPVVDALEEDVLMVTDGDVLELGRGGYDLEETLELGALAKRHAEDLNGDVRNVVVCGKKNRESDLIRG